MTQEEHLESSHQASNSVYDQVNDDSDKSKNITTSNQMNGARSNSTSGDIDAIDKALNFSDNKGRQEGDNNLTDFDKFNSKISEVKSSDCNNNLNMTVITHQGSSENIREIQTKIENSEKVPSGTSGSSTTAGSDDSKLVQKDSGNSGENESVTTNEIENEAVVNKSNESTVITNSCENSGRESDTSKDNKGSDDPFARLKALKANISNVLREVKAVLSEHGEPANEPETDEIKPSDDNAIRFRFVRRIRKKSIFEEDEEKKKNESSGDSKRDETPAVDEDGKSIAKKKDLLDEDLSRTGQSIKHADQNHKPNESNTIQSEPPVESDKAKDARDVPITNSEQANVVESKDGHIIPKETIESNEPIYQVKVVDVKNTTELVDLKEKSALIAEVDKGLPEKREIPNNANLDKNHTETKPIYSVKVIETEATNKQEQLENVSNKDNKIPLEQKPLDESKKEENNQKPTTDTKVSNEVIKSDAPIEQTIPLENEQIFKIRIIESNTTETQKELKDANSISTSKSNKEKPASVEKSQEKVLKTKSSTNKSADKLEKPKIKTEKNDSSNGRPKVKKVKGESEITKNEKRIKKAESMDQDGKCKTNNTTNGSKLKSKRSGSIDSHKTSVKKEKDSKPLVPMPSKDTISVSSSNLVSPAAKSIAPVSSKNVTQSKSEPSALPDLPQVSRKDLSVESSNKTPLAAPLADAKNVALTKSLNEQSSEKVKAEEKESLVQGNVLETKTAIKPAEKVEFNENKSSAASEKIATVQTDLKASKESAPSEKDMKPSEPSATLPNLENLNSSAQKQVKPISALEKVLATTNLTVLEIRPPLPTQIVPPLETTALPEKMPSLAPQAENSTIRTEIKSSPPTKNTTEIRRHSLPVSNDDSKPKTSSTSSPPSTEKVNVKPETNQINNQQQNNHDANGEIRTKIESVDNSQQNDVKTCSEKKPVDKVKIPLEIASDKIGTVAVKPALTLLPSPSKAIELTPSKLELVPISAASPILIKGTDAATNKGVISSEPDKVDTPQSTSIDDCLAAQEESQVTQDKDEVPVSENAQPEKEVTKPQEAPSDSKKRKLKKKVVIKRVRRRLSADGTPGRRDSIDTAEPEICEKELRPVTPQPEPEPEPEPENEQLPPGPKSCLKLREFHEGDIVLYNDRIKKIAKWKKAIVLERITSISYKLNVEGEDKSCHVCYIKKYTDKKVQFGGKEYLEIDYAQDEDDEEEEEYNIWARV